MKYHKIIVVAMSVLCLIGITPIFASAENVLMKPQPYLNREYEFVGCKVTSDNIFAYGILPLTNDSASVSSSFDEYYKDLTTNNGMYTVGVHSYDGIIVVDGVEEMGTLEILSTADYAIQWFFAVTTFSSDFTTRYDILYGRTRGVQYRTGDGVTTVNFKPCALVRQEVEGSGYILVFVTCDYYDGVYGVNPIEVWISNGDANYAIIAGDGEEIGGVIPTSAKIPIIVTKPLYYEVMDGNGVKNDFNQWFSLEQTEYNSIIIDGYTNIFDKMIESVDNAYSTETAITTVVWYVFGTALILGMVYVIYKCFRR